MSAFRHVWLLLFCLLAACASLKDFDDPVVELAGIKALAPEGFEQRMQITLRVINPNPQAFTIEGVYSELSIQGNAVLNGVSSQVVTVPAYGEASVDVEASVSLMKSLGLLKDLMMNPSLAGLDYHLSTKLSIKELFGTVRLTREGTLDLDTPAK